MDINQVLTHSVSQSADRTVGQSFCSKHLSVMQLFVSWIAQVQPFYTNLFCSLGGVISSDSVVASLVERDDTDILGRMALKLDGKKTHNWKHLALQLNVPHRVLRNFGSHQRHNSSLMLLKYIPIFDPELTLDQLKGSLASIGRQDVLSVLDKAGIPGIIL